MISPNPGEFISVLCSPPTMENSFVLKCDLGNPMMGFSKISLRTLVMPMMNDGNAMPIELKVSVNSSNPELNASLDNNMIQARIPVYVDTDIIIRGLSDPDPLRHNSTAFENVNLETVRHESEIGPELIHIYQVENKGPSDILEAQVFILWPSFRPNGDPLLYLTSQPIIEGMARCDIVEDVNPFQVDVDRYHMSSSSSKSSRPIYTNEDYVNDQESDQDLLDRPKRSNLEMQVQEFESELILSPGSRDKQLLDHLDCGPTKCTHMICTVGPLKKKESVVFRIYSRLWSSTISRLSHHQYEISSRLVAVVTKLPHNVDPSFLDIKSYTVTSKVISVGTDFLEGRGIPLWILLLAVLAGLVLIALLSLILWHLGFFRRRRHDQHQMHNGAVIQANDAALFMHEATVHEKEPLAATATIKNGFHHRHSRQSLTYPHHMQPGDEVL